MKGVVCEVAGLTRRKELNGKRGYIQKSVEKSPDLKYVVNIDDMDVIMSNKHMHKVYCLGLPCEYYKCEKNTDNKVMLHTVLSQVCSTEFYVFVRSNRDYTMALIVNIAFFEIALHKMTTEPLLRIYATSKSQNETKIIFDQVCVHPPCDHVSKPWYVDLSSNEFLDMLSRFQSCNDAKQLRALNLQDYS